MEKNSSFDIAVVLINYNTEEDIIALIRQMTTFSGHFLFIIYDNKQDFTFEKTLRGLSGVSIIYYPDAVNSGYCAAVNFCLGLIRTEFSDIPQIALLNSDIEFGENTLSECSAFLRENPTFIAVNPLIYDGSGNVWFSGGYFNNKNLTVNSYRPNGDTGNNCDFYNGCFVVFSNKVLDFQLDDKLFMYYDEFDLSRRLLEKGFKIKLLNTVSIVHHVSKSLSGMNHLKTYYKSRNYLYIIRKYHHRHLLPVYKALFRSSLSLLWHGEYKSLQYLLRAISDFRRGRMGKIAD